MTKTAQYYLSSVSISDTLAETVPECVKCGLALGAAIRILIEGDESQS